MPVKRPVKRSAPARKPVAQPSQWDILARGGQINTPQQNIQQQVQQSSRHPKWEKFKKGLKEFGLGTPAQLHQISRFTPTQQQALSQILGMGMQGLQKAGPITTPIQAMPMPPLPQGVPFPQQQGDIYQGWAPIEEQARKNFYQQTVPSLAERFSSMGQNAISSPAYNSLMSQAGADLETGLGALKSQYGFQNRDQMQRQQQLEALYGLQNRQQQMEGQQYQAGYGLDARKLQMLQGDMQRNQLMNLLGYGLGEPYNNVTTPAQEGLFPGLWRAGSKAAGTAAGYAMMAAV